MNFTFFKGILALFLFLGAVQVQAQNTIYKVAFDSLFKTNQIEEALKLSEKLESEEHKNGPSLNLAFVINRKGHATYLNGDWQTADSLFRQAISIATDAGKAETLDFTDFLFSLAKLAGEVGNFEESLDLFYHILDIQTKLLGEDDKFNMRMRSNISVTYFIMGKFSNALEFALGSIAIYERNQWPKDAQYIIIERDAGLALSELGRFSASKQHYREALELARNIWGESDHRYLSLLYTYCYSLHISGDYSELEPTATHLIESLRKVPDGDKSGTMQLALNLLGTTKLMIGLYPEAIKIFKEAKQVANVCCGLGLTERAEVSINLAQAYILTGQLDSAYAQILEYNIIDLEKREQGIPVSYVQKTDLAIRLAYLHKTNEAEALITEIENSVQWNEENLVTLKGSYLKAKLALASENNQLHDVASLIDSLIQNTITVKGQDSWDLIPQLTEKSRVHFLLYNDSLSLATLMEMLQLKYKLVFAQMALLSDSERRNLSEQFSEESSLLSSIAKRNPNLNATQILADLLIFNKCILEKTSRKLAQIIQESNDPKISTLYKEWIDLREELNFTTGDQTVQIRIEEAAEILEKKLSRQGFANVLPEKQIFLSDIQAQLYPTEAIVDVLRFNKLDQIGFSDSISYVFLIVTPGNIQPKLVFCDNGNELESFILGQYQNEITRKKDLSTNLYEKMWAPVAAHLQGVKTIYFSPDGIFHKINLNTLRAADGTYLLDNIQIKQVTNLRNILDRGQETSGREPGMAALFGNPAFKTGPISTTSNTPADITTRTPLYRDIAEDAKGDFQLTPLPGSEREVNAIAKKLTGKNWQTAVFTGAQATEDTLKHLKSPKVLHIATHGYFLNSEKTASTIGFASPHAGKNPALRSMLFLAGAENSIAGENTGRNDGILTAFEAAVLNLDQTELVVLSACNTGLGKIQNGEGVFGLQRAFRIAGAKSLIMSLWEVEDAATELLMNTFYENWLSGMSKSEAFRKAQLTLKAKYPQPFYWGSFILVNG